MHPTRSFHWTDRDAMLAFAAETSFAHIFVQTPEGPRVAHAPVIVTPRGDLRFHLARSNAVARYAAGLTALASIAGNDFYVSPDWYASDDQVPTWNYQAVEVEGVVRRLDDAALIDLLDALSASHEARLQPKAPWTRGKMTPGRFEAMLPAIVGFELQVAEMRGTSKLSQNKAAADIGGVVAALRTNGRLREAELVVLANEARL